MAVSYFYVYLQNIHINIPHKTIKFFKTPPPLIPKYNILQQPTEMNQQSQASKITQQFRKEIRRKDIDRILAERRKQFLLQQKQQQQQMNKKKNCLDGNGSESESQNQKLEECQTMVQDVRNTGPVNKHEQVMRNYSKNSGTLTKSDVKKLGKISCSVAGSQAIICSPKPFLQYLINQYIMNNAHIDTDQLEWTLLIFNNCLTVSSPIYTPQYPTTTSTLSSCNYTLNYLTTSESFLNRIFRMALESTKTAIRENTMSIIFNIVYNSEPVFIYTLVTDPKYMIISVFFNQMHCQPNKTIMIDTFRSYYLIMKKLEFGNYQQFGKMRKFVAMMIRNSNCLELTLLGVICLQSLLKSLPAQKSIFSKTGLLNTIFTQALALGNNKLALHTINIASLMVQNKNQHQIKQIISFIEQSLPKFLAPEFTTLCFKTLYDIIINSLISIENLLAHHPRLYTSLMEILDSSNTNKGTLTEAALCAVIIAAKSKIGQRARIEEVRGRVKNLIENCQFDQKSVQYLENSLEILDSCSQMGQF